jgi:hypothetical protein
MLALLQQCGVVDLASMKPAIQAQVLNTALNNPATIQAWNQGVDSRTGAPFPVQPAPKPAPVVFDDHEHDVQPTEDPDDLPAAWAAD